MLARRADRLTGMARWSAASRGSSDERMVAMDKPLLPDYGGRVHHQRRPGAARAAATSHRSGCRAAAVDGRPGRAARARRARLGAARRPAPSPRADARRPWPAARSPRVAPSTTATALTSIATGPDAGRARRRRLPHARRTARCSTSCAGRRPPATPAVASRRSSSSRMPRSAGTGRPIVTQGRVRALRLHRRPPRRRPLQRLPGAVDARRPRSRGCCAPASRSSTPTTTASTRSPTSTAWASTTTPSCVAADRLVGRPARGAPRRRRRCVVTADHGQVDVGDSLVAARTRRRWPTSSLPVGRGPVPLAARPARAGRRRCSRPPPQHHGDVGLGAHPRGDDRRGLVRARVDRRRRGPPRRRRPRRPGRRRLRRPDRHRPVRARRPARLADRRPRCSSPCWSDRA